MVTPSAEFADDPHSDDVEVCQAHRRVFEKSHGKKKSRHETPVLQRTLCHQEAVHLMANYKG